MIVLDASVITKWFIEEEGSERAVLYEEAHTEGYEKIVVPALVFYEVANVFRYKRGVESREIEYAFDIIEDLEFEVFDFSPSELKEVFRFAHHYDVSVYDGVYGFLAERLGCEFVTADKKLKKKLEALSWVRVL